MPQKKSATHPIVFEETFDTLKLAFILENFETFPLREETIDGEDHWSPIAIMTETLRMVKKGVLEVKYKQSKNDIGRYYAFKGRSLQGMPREIRHTIARDFYYDIDIVNAHPSLLLQYCKKNSIKCSALEDYVINRDARLSDLISKTGLSKDDCKRGILALTNGGIGMFRDDVMDACPDWVFKYKQNIDRIHDAIMQKEEEFAKIGEKNAKEKKKAGKFYNPKGSTVNLLLCDLENRVLMAMTDFGKKIGVIKNNAVLVFDGIMINKKSITETGRDLNLVLRDMEHYVEAVTGYSISLIEKPMNDHLLLPDKLVLRDVETIIRDDENEASILFYERIKDDVRKCGNVIFVRRGGVWISDEKEVERILLDKCMCSKFKKINDDGDVENYSSKLSGSRSIVQATLCRIPDTSMFIDDMWWSNKGKLVWKNGYYDFTLGRFIEGFDGCDSVIQIDRPFPRQRNQELIDEVYRRVIDPILGDDIKTPFMQYLARAIAGHCEDKNWGVMMGQRDCGKGVLATIAQTAFQNYVVSISPESLLCQRLSMAGDEAKKLSWAFVMEHSRLAITNEIRLNETDKLKLDGNIIKKVASGGDMMMGRQNYKDERLFRIQASLLLNCNDLPDIDPADACEKLLPFACPNKFTNDEKLLSDYPDFMRPADDSIKAFCRRSEVGDAFFWIVSDYYRQMRPSMSSSMIEFKSDFHTEDETDKIKKHFIITKYDNDFISNEQVNEFLRVHKVNMTLKKFSLLITQLKAKKTRVFRGGKDIRGFTGVKFLETSDNSDSF